MNLKPYTEKTHNHNQHTLASQIRRVKALDPFYCGVTNCDYKCLGKWGYYPDYSGKEISFGDCCFKHSGHAPVVNLLSQGDWGYPGYANPKVRTV